MFLIAGSKEDNGSSTLRGEDANTGKATYTLSLVLKVVATLKDQDTNCR